MDEPPKKGGYVKWFHASLNHPLFKRYEIWHYFQFCVLRAWWSDEPTRQEISGEIVELEKGQFISTLRGDSNQTGLSVQQIRTSRRILEKYKNLTLHVTPNYTIVTVCKYPLFQERKIGSQHTNQHTTNTKVTHHQHINKNVKKGKPVNLNKSVTGVGDFRRSKQGLSPEAQTFKKLLEERKKNNEKAKSQGS